MRTASVRAPGGIPRDHWEQWEASVPVLGLYPGYAVERGFPKEIFCKMEECPRYELRNWRIRTVSTAVSAPFFYPTRLGFSSGRWATEEARANDSEITLTRREVWAMKGLASPWVRRCSSRSAERSKGGPPKRAASLGSPRNFGAIRGK
ncbi:hypothetical protein KM043_012273 [Ampulex compressa]|nr:hypothetical protein KM043_012273 [Ampulex compressa]